MPSPIEVLIVTYNARHALKKCLLSIVKHTTEPVSIIIVDNCSKDGTSDFLRKNWSDKATIIRTERNLGFSGGVNLGLRKCTSEFVALLDDDVEVQKGWLEGLLREIRKCPRIGIVGPKIIDHKNKIFCADYIVPLLYLNGQGEKDSSAYEYVRRCDALVGPCWLIRQSILRKVGYFDESFYPSQHEDIDLCLRARLAGYFIVYNGKVTVKHRHLYRAGSLMQKSVAFSSFLTKWEGQISNFPLRNSHAVDKYVSRCLKHIKSGDWQMALGEYKKAKPFKSGFLEKIMLALQYIEQEKFYEASVIMLQVYDKYPNNGVLLELTRLYQKAGMYRESRKAGDKFLEEFQKSRSQRSN